MIKFSVSRLDKETIELTGTEPPEFLELTENDYEITSNVSYDLKVEKVSGGVLVTGSCEVNIAGICGRCLVPVEATVFNDEISLFYETYESSGDEIDISEDIRCELLLEFPMNLLCDDDCPGLCPECGVDLNKEQCKCKGPSGSLAWSALDDLKL